MTEAPETPRKQEQTPSSPFHNEVRTTGRAFNSPNWRMKREESPNGNSPGSPNVTVNTSRFAFSRPSSHVPQAISEGRRLYVGNMPYTAKLEDVQTLFSSEGYKFTRVDIAIDPFTRRNPSYCFVDLETKEQADRALIELDGRDFLGRPLKIRPGFVKSSNERPQQQLDDSPRNEKKSMASFNRWQRNDIPTPSKNDSDQSRRVYVGGLPRLGDQETINIKITSFFGGLHVESISKLFPPHPSKRFEPGDHYYLFVDFSSPEEAQTAMNTMTGRDGPWGGVVRVQKARGDFTKSDDKRENGATSEAN